MCISCTYWYVSLYAKGLLKWSQVFVFGRWWYHTQKNNVWYTLLLCHVKLTMSKYTHLMEMYGKVNYVCQMCATQRYGNENRSRSESICVYRTQLKPFGLDKAGKLVRRKVFFFIYDRTQISVDFCLVDGDFTWHIRMPSNTLVASYNYSLYSYISNLCEDQRQHLHTSWWCANDDRHWSANPTKIGVSNSTELLLS